MARPKKIGMDYFPVDTTWDVKMQLVKAKYGLEGIGCIIELFKAIYHEGYFLKWDEDTRLLFASENKIDENKLAEIVGFAVGKRLFHAGKLDKLGVLTSRGIQKRWLQVAKDSNRTTREIDKNIDLMSEEEFPAQETEFPAQEIHAKNVVSGTDNPHIILNESILNKSKEENIICPDSDPDKHKRFKKPTIEEVQAYCLERRNSVNPEKFIDHYESVGWKVGNKPMKNWQAAVRTWEKTDFASGKLKVNERATFLDLEE